MKIQWRTKEKCRQRDLASDFITIKYRSSSLEVCTQVLLESCFFSSHDRLIAKSSLNQIAQWWSPGIVKQALLILASGWFSGTGGKSWIRVIQTAFLMVQYTFMGQKGSTQTLYIKELG
ncbi:hypothetical protein FGO68_gene15656 [Halteria grandinella]|uniref:Uncharacterized protein n=1 Tax=Halteria grandinella TaxID=5974 RepID=A0A8J8NAI8_HALGN|nr:hypothetical protein FGO68_gene15656 [Halteria grandinella]